MSRAKGNRTRRKCIDHYTEQGWLVEVVEKTGKYVKEKDLFGLFDLIAIRSGVTLYIQVKTNRPAAQKLFREFAQEHCNKNFRCIVQTWYDRKGWRIQEYMKNGTIDETDLR